MIKVFYLNARAESKNTRTVQVHREFAEHCAPITYKQEM